MTTHRDWLFRAEYLRLQARGLRERAEALTSEAERYDWLANSAQSIAEEALGRAIDNLEVALSATARE